MTKPCPTCGKPAEWSGNPNRPFCSERCRLIDLGHWADENYSVPVENPDLEELIDDLESAGGDGVPEDFQPS